MNVIQLNKHNASRFNNETRGNCIILFFHPLCHHCQNMKPHWEKVKNNNSNKSIKIVEVDNDALSQLNHPLKDVVHGYPSIVSSNNGTTTIMNEEMTEPNINSFINKNYANNSSISMKSVSLNSNNGNKSKSKNSNGNKSKSKKSKSNKRTAKKRTAKKRTAKKRTAKKRTAKKRTAKKRTAK